jgi:hypothetical protein
MKHVALDTISLDGCDKVVPIFSDKPTELFVLKLSRYQTKRAVNANRQSIKSVPASEMSACMFA